MTADQWNRDNPIGIDVNLTEDDGSITKTRTRSEAWSLGSEVAVILVDGRVGGYALSRISPA